MLGAFRYPLSGEARAKTLAVGILLASLGALVIPAVPVAGYYGRVLASSSTGSRTPPRFDRWRALFAQGLKTWSVVALYLLFALLLLVTLGVIALALDGLATTGGALASALALVVGLALLVGLFVLPAWFFFPVALIRVARTDSVIAAFHVRTIVGIATDRRYLSAWAGGVAMLLLGSVGYLLTGGVGGLLGDLLLPGAPVGGASIAGHVVGVAINFYCQIVAFHLFGRGYAAATGETGEPIPEQGADATSDVDESTAGYDGWGAEARAWREQRRE